MHQPIGQNSHMNNLDKQPKSGQQASAAVSSSKKRRKVLVKRKTVRSSLRLSSLSQPFLHQTDNTPLRTEGGLVREGGTGEMNTQSSMTLNKRAAAKIEKDKLGHMNLKSASNLKQMQTGRSDKFHGVSCFTSTSNAVRNFSSIDCCFPMVIDDRKSARGHSSFAHNTQSYELS